MLLACLQHVSFEGPGSIARWAAARGHLLKEIHLFEGQSLPSTEEFDLLLVMGGPMSIHDEAEYGWLLPEKRLIARSLDQNKFVLGICLGSQLLADSCGSRVYRNRVREIGWFPIRLRPEVSQSPCFAGLPNRMDVLHWHGETYDLPPGCIHLADSEGCLVQAFEHRFALGLQFHLEVTQAGVQELIHRCGHEIGSGPYEQSPEELAAGALRHEDAAQTALFGILDRIEQRIGIDRQNPESA